MFVVHPQYNIAHMMLNKPYNEVDAAQFAQAVTMLIGGIVFAVALWIFASYWSLRDLRFTQTFIWGLTQPIRNVLLDRITSRQVQKKVSPTPIFRPSTGLTLARRASVRARVEPPEGTRVR